MAILTSYSPENSNSYTRQAAAGIAQAAAVADDYTNQISGAGKLLVGGTTKGKLEVAGDKDWFAVSLTANTTYWFTAKPDTGSGTYSSYSQFKIYDGSSSLMTSINGNNSSTILSYMPTKSGTYYFEVSDYSNYSIGNYVASAEVGRDDYGNDKATAAPIALDSLVSGKLELTNDRDAFKIAVQAGTTYVFELKSQVAGSSSYYLDLSGQNASGSSNGFVEYIMPGVSDYRVYTATYTGDYIVTVSSIYGVADLGYTLKVSSAANDDYAGSAATTAVLAPGGRLKGELNYVGDTDWIKVSLVAGSKYAFVLDGASNGGGTLDTSSGVNVTMVTPQGSTTYDFSAMYGVAGRGYTYTAASTGDYYLAVTPNNYYSNSPAIGSYTMSAHNLSNDTSMPEVVAFSPAPGAKGVGLGSNITLTFNELIRGGDSSIRLIDARGNAVETYSFGGSDKRVQISEKVLTINPSVNLQAGTKYTVELQAGSVQDYAGNKFLADEMYRFTTREAVAQGTSGNDLLSGIGTNIRLDGGAGIDTVVYGSAYYYYRVSRSDADTKVLYTGGGGAPAGSVGDTLTGVERLLFSDRAIALDINGNGGQAYRLLQAAYNKATDLAGLGYAIDQLDQGKSAQTAAQSILSSTEFRKVYGADVSNETFIGNLYQNALHRQGDAGGIAAWSNMLSQGMSRAEALVIFSGTAENTAEVLKLIGNGFEYTPYG